MACRKAHFKSAMYYLAPVPTYTGGFMAFGWACDKKYRVSLETLRKKMKKMQGKMKYYTPAIHKAAFQMPAYVNSKGS